MSKTAIFATKKSLFVDNLVGMILGQYPFLGTITLNDKKEYEINKREFYSSIGLLSKDQPMPDITIREYFEMGVGPKDNINEETIQEALKASNSQ